MLNAQSGIPTFVDNLIVLLAARCGASLDKLDDAWDDVANGVSTFLRHPASDDERSAVRHVDPFSFTPAICLHRAQYLQWRATKDREIAGSRKNTSGDLATTKPSGFNVTRDSLTNDVQRLMDNVRNSLPTTLGAADEDDDDDTVPVAIHEFAHKSAEEAARDRAVAEAEDALMQQIQQLQLDFFRTHRRWVDAPLIAATAGGGSSASGSVPASRGGGAAAATSPSKSAAAAAGGAKSLGDFTVDDVAAAFEELDIAEHKAAFRRTTGRMLSLLDRAAMKERFNGDAEAADILWFWVEEHRGTGGGADPSRVRQTIGALRAPGAAVQATSRSLQDFQTVQGIRPSTTSAAVAAAASGRGGDSDPLQMLKRALNPARPPRPSEDPDYEAALGDDEDLAALGAAFLQAAKTPPPRAPAGSAPTTATAVATVGKAAVPLRGGGGGGGGGASSTTSAAAMRETAPPSRANRWEIVEYDDDDEDEEDE